MLYKLSKSQQVQITIPETFIYGFGFKKPTLLSTDYATGNLTTRKNVTKLGVLECGVLFEEVRSDKQLPIMLLKQTPQNNGKDHCIALFNSTDVSVSWNEIVDSNQECILQRYIMPTVSGKISLVKATWDCTKNSIRKLVYQKKIQKTDLFKHALINWISPLVRAQGSFYIINRNDNYSIFEIPNSELIDRKIQELVHVIEKMHQDEIKLALIEAYYMRDQHGYLYLINVKNYKIIQRDPKLPRIQVKSSLKNSQSLKSLYNARRKKNLRTRFNA